jgi:UDP-N-acetylglucosamine 2-epimerase (non-hydrolysing)/GDP/UDP-N,N'-diacetylbacillosamine 2-epimerase (hydrolysing)
VRTLAVVTVARSDFGIYLPMLKRILGDPRLRLHLLVSGMHLSPEFGRTVAFIEESGIPIAERIEMLLSSDTPEAISKSMGLGLIGYAQAYSRQRPDLLVVLGDRFEMLPAALAALPFRIPVAHIHGGELTMGAMDDALRHSITKLSHLHFVSTEEYARRVRQMGEESWRVTVCGAPSLDNLKTVPVLSKAQLEPALGFVLGEPSLLVTFHPVTLEPDKLAWQFGELLRAVELSNAQAIFTLPNADTAGRQLAKHLREFVSSHSKARLVENLGTELYFNLMRHATVMVGNSSSGIIEAPSFSLPVVNIGARQAGRVRGRNVIDVEDGCLNILNGIHRALAPEFRASLRGLSNPYWSGQEASGIVVERLGSIELDQQLLQKRFCDWPREQRPDAQA